MLLIIAEINFKKFDKGQGDDFLKRKKLRRQTEKRHQAPGAIILSFFFFFIWWISEMRTHHRAMNSSYNHFLQFLAE